MLSDVKTFKTPVSLGSMDIRVVPIDGNPWFVANDVCKVLGIADKSTALRSFRADEKGAQTLRTPGGIQQMSVISESGLYKLIMRSYKPEARAFQDWVTRDVLPAIRKDGGYILGEEKVATGELSEAEFILQAMTILQNKVGRLTEENAKLRVEVEQVTVDEYFALTHRYATRAAKCKLGATATALARQTGTTLERQFRALGRKQVHVNVYPRSLLERAEAKA